MKIVVITGGAKGLGFSLTQALVQSGEYYVIAIGRGISGQIEELIKAHPENVSFEPFDLSDIEKIRHFATQLSKKYGRIYGLINNAAVGFDGILPTMHETEISQLLKVNVEAPIILTKYLLRPMLMNKVGRVINISSIIAHTGYKGLAVYGASKAAMIGFSKSLARDVGSGGITVNAIAPGYMITEMTAGLPDNKLDSIKRRSPMNTFTPVEDVAAMALYLLSEPAKSITGTVLTVDVGSTA